MNAYDGPRRLPSLVQLETFRTLAAEENFTRTAEVLNITQPAVTQQIRALAEHFGVNLVDVVGRHTVLTDAGRFLVERAATLLGNVQSLERDMRAFADARAGELRLGATVTIGSYALPDLVARFHAKHPAIRLQVDIGNTEAMALAVKMGRVSLALIEGPLADDELSIERYAADELILITNRSHPLAKKRKPVAAAELANVPFVFREEGSGTRALAESALRKAGVEPAVVLTLPLGEGIVRAVELGLGVAILSRLIADEPLRNGRVAHVRLRDLSFPRTFRVVRLKSHTASPAVLAFTNLLFAD